MKKKTSARSRAPDPIRTQSRPEKRGCSRYTRDDLVVLVKHRRLIFGSPTVGSRVLDVSLNGLALAFDGKVRRGSRLELIVKFRDSRVYSLDGKVIHHGVRNEESICGLQFENSNSAFKDHLLKTGVQIKLSRRL